MADIKAAFYNASHPMIASARENEQYVGNYRSAFGLAQYTTHIYFVLFLSA